MKSVKSITELKKLNKEGIPLYWNDPDPIKSSDYRINWIESLDNIDDSEIDLMLDIQYNSGASNVQVYLHEIIY